MFINFTKMHGLGNDFIVINNLDGIINLTTKQICYLADRNFGIGFDQLLLIAKSTTANIDFRYIIYNADGSEVEQCGNGARCFARFVKENKLSNNNPIKVQTNAGILSLFVDNNLVVVDMGKADFSSHSIILDDKYNDIYNIVGIDMHLLSIGNPHAVIIVDNLDSIDIKAIGSKIQQDSIFLNSINVGFMQIVAKDKIKLRVFERGVGETLACGSGACAAVAVGIKQKLLDNKVIVKLNGGNVIVEQKIENIFLTGPAEFVFTGVVEL